MAPAVHASPEASLHSVAARDRQRAEALEPEGASVVDYRAVLADDRVEAVYISLTNEAHLPWITSALHAGKHVLCEKPLALDAGQARAAYDAARAADRLLVEAAWTQWHPRTRRVDTLVRQGDLGPVRSILASFTFDGVPSDNYRLDASRGGGSLLDVGPYVLRPAAVWVPASWHVEKVLRQVSPPGVDLSTTAHLLASDGAAAQVHTSFVEPEHQALQLVGDQLSVTWGPPAFTSWGTTAELDLRDGAAHWQETFPACDAYTLMVSSVSRRIRGDTEAYLVEESEVVRCAELLDAIAGTRDAS
jgi:xylose dehydrogenase (NAD/NADP)